jgi:hypothetical protein
MTKRLLVILIIFSALKSNAQEGTSSPYSFYGIGSLKFKGTVENQSMGGLSIYTDSIHVNLRNPASYGGSGLELYEDNARLVKFTVAGTHSSLSLKSEESSDKTTSTTFDYLAIAIPIGKLGVGFGLLPYTSVGYKLENDNLAGDIGNRYTGQGGVNKVFLGAGYQLTKELSVGLNVDYNFGNIQNKAIEFQYNDEDELLQYQARQEDRSDLSGISYNFGVSFKKTFDKLQLVSGLTFAPESKLSSENQREFATIVINPNTGLDFPVNTIDGNPDLVANGLKNTELTIPSRLSFGAGLGEPRKWFVGIEYVSQNTGDFSNPLLDTSENSTNTTTFENASTVSFGGFYIPNYNSLTSYFKRIVYRGGMRFENTGLNIGGETINEFGISFGVGLPVGRSVSNVNLGFEIGKRGTTSQNLVQENFVNFQLSLSLNDRWFQKRKYN